MRRVLTALELVYGHGVKRKGVVGLAEAELLQVVLLPVPRRGIRVRRRQKSLDHFLYIPQEVALAEHEARCERPSVVKPPQDLIREPVLCPPITRVLVRPVSALKLCGRFPRKCRKSVHFIGVRHCDRVT